MLLHCAGEDVVLRQTSNPVTGGMVSETGHHAGLFHICLVPMQKIYM